MEAPPADHYFHVSHHALHRWQKRASEGAHDGIDSVVAAIRQSRRIGPDDITSFPRQPGTHYYIHPNGCYFVVKPYDCTRSAVLTVIVPGFEDKPILTPKKRIKPEVTDGQGDGEDDETSGSEIEQQWQALTADVLTVQAELGNTSRGQPDRKKLLKKLADLLKQKAELRPVYKELRRQSAEGDEVYGAEGWINHTAAIKMLLTKVAELESQIALLNERLAHAGSILQKRP